MRRSILILLGVIAAAGIVFASAYFMARRTSLGEVGDRGDDLSWLRVEFRLSETEMARIQKLHNEYLPICATNCQKIAVEKQKLETLLQGTNGFSPEIAEAMARVAQVRGECQAQMLQHFVQVSQAMPPEPGRRYLAEMQRMTLGAHEQVEQTMSHPAGEIHGDHH